MLHRLSVKNFILIEKLDIEFHEGLCTITGETGAGKSILLDSLQFCLGGRFNASIIKQGSDAATVTAEFSMNEPLKEFLISNDIEIEDSLLIKRHQNLKNQKKFYINDTPVTSRLISEIAELLVDYHGQNQHNYLENSHSHIKVLDSFAKLEELNSLVSEKYKTWRSFSEQLEQITSKRAQIEGEKSYLEFVVDELSKASIELDEEEKLSLLRIELQQKAKSEQLIADTLSIMDNQTFENKVMQMQKTLSKLSENEKFNQIIELLDQSLIYYNEAKELLHSFNQNNDSGYSNLEEIEERLFFIKGLCRKYNTNSNNLITLLKDSSSKLTELSERLENSEYLRNQLDKAQTEYLKYASTLSEKRQNAALALESRVNNELKFLKMEKANFKVDISKLDLNNAHHTGIDDVRFLASTNPGTPLAPIDKIASGGELSRLMLALKVVAYPATIDKETDIIDTMPCMIFDEIDTGLGGMVASLVGDRLQKLAHLGQVIVITHQPQVAGLAKQHILVQKHQTENHTEVRISSLDKAQRLEEVARMLAGKQVTQATREAALELIGE
jgi:DNA repair protein RecN (Recombination protein N)